MATVFLEPGGDATSDFKFWVSGGATIATDILHGGHQRSIQVAANSSQLIRNNAATLNTTNGRINFYIYLTALPTGTSGFFFIRNTSTLSVVVALRLTSAGVLQIWNSRTAQIGANGSSLTTGRWYRISLAYSITSTTVNRFELFVDGASSISITNATITNIAPDAMSFGNDQTDLTLDFRISDIYADDSNSLRDPGNIWVTAKRPVANGTTNDFTTRIGSGGSGYGTGHAPQVNERPLSTTNGWSMVGAGSAVTEEYTIEAANVGDISITGSQIIDYTGWIWASALASETGSIIVNGVSSNIALTSTNTLFIATAGSSVYPSTGAAIGITTSTTLTTVSLYEAGIIIAYIPGQLPNNYQFVKVGNGMSVSEKIR